MSDDRDVADFQSRTFLHDLAQPMTRIRFLVENLLRLETGELSPPRPGFRLELIEKIRAASDEMIVLHAQYRAKLGSEKIK